MGSPWVTAYQSIADGNDLLLSGRRAIAFGPGFVVTDDPSIVLNDASGAGQVTGATRVSLTGDGTTFAWLGDAGEETIAGAGFLRFGYGPVLIAEGLAHTGVNLRALLGWENGELHVGSGATSTDLDATDTISMGVAGGRQIAVTEAGNVAIFDSGLSFGDGVKVIAIDESSHDVTTVNPAGAFVQVSPARGLMVTSKNGARRSIGPLGPSAGSLLSILDQAESVDTVSAAPTQLIQIDLTTFPSCRFSARISIVVSDGGDRQWFEYVMRGGRDPGTSSGNVVVDDFHAVVPDVDPGGIGATITETHAGAIAGVSGTGTLAALLWEIRAREIEVWV